MRRALGTSPPSATWWYVTAPFDLHTHDDVRPWGDGQDESDLTFAWRLQESGSSLLASDHGNGNSVLHNAARNGHLWALTYLLRAAARAGMDKEQIKRFLEVRGLSQTASPQLVRFCRYPVSQGEEWRLRDSRGTV